MEDMEDAQRRFEKIRNKFNNNKIELLHTAYTPRIGWEYDGYIWLVMFDGKPELWSTSHGGLRRNVPSEMTNGLSEHRDGFKMWLDAMNEMLEQIENLTHRLKL